MNTVKALLGMIVDAAKAFWRSVKEYERMREEHVNKCYEEGRE